MCTIMHSVDIIIMDRHIGNRNVLDCMQNFEFSDTLHNSGELSFGSLLSWLTFGRDAIVYGYHLGISWLFI
jgi:hypothetical protein